MGDVIQGERSGEQERRTGCPAPDRAPTCTALPRTSLLHCLISSAGRGEPPTAAPRCTVLISRRPHPSCHLLPALNLRLPACSLQLRPTPWCPPRCACSPFRWLWPSGGAAATRRRCRHDTACLVPAGAAFNRLCMCHTQTARCVAVGLPIGLGAGMLAIHSPADVVGLRRG